MKNNESVNVSGNLEIWKIYHDGSEELLFDERNTITSGMGVGLGLLYAGSGATSITNFQIRYFQLGVKGDSVLTNYTVSTTALVSALGQVNGVADYKGTQSTIPISNHELMAWNGAASATTEGETTWAFGLMSDSNIKRVDLNSVTYIIYLDRNTCNDQILNEVGLFMKNPLGRATDRSNLVAYRPFTDITKTNDFSLIFKWTLNF
jgi:hypothetical protein